MPLRSFQVRSAINSWNAVSVQQHTCAIRFQCKQIALFGRKNCTTSHECYHRWRGHKSRESHLLPWRKTSAAGRRFNRFTSFANSSAIRFSLNALNTHREIGVEFGVNHFTLLAFSHTAIASIQLASCTGGISVRIFSAGNWDLSPHEWEVLAVYGEPPVLSKQQKRNTH